MGGCRMMACHLGMVAQLHVRLAQHGFLGRGRWPTTLPPNRHTWGTCKVYTFPFVQEEERGHLETTNHPGPPDSGPMPTRWS